MIDGDINQQNIVMFGSRIGDKMDKEHITPEKLSSGNQQVSSCEYLATKPLTTGPVHQSSMSKVDYKTRSKKPPHSYAKLISMAIGDSENGKCTLYDIFAWIEVNFMYYRTINRKWHDIVRHNLQMNKCFQQESPQERSEDNQGIFWIISSDHVDQFQNKVSGKRTWSSVHSSSDEDDIPTKKHKPDRYVDYQDTYTLSRFTSPKNVEDKSFSQSIDDSWRSVVLRDIKIGVEQSISDIQEEFVSPLFETCSNLDKNIEDSLDVTLDLSFATDYSIFSSLWEEIIYDKCEYSSKIKECRFNTPQATLSDPDGLNWTENQTFCDNEFNNMFGTTFNTICSDRFVGAVC